MLTKQEMFDRAWKGLKSQGWQQALIPSERVENGAPEGRCVYLTDDGKRCAWGWVDPDHTPGNKGSVYSLKNHGIGLAAELEEPMLSFGWQLQRAHDCMGVITPPSEIEERFRHIAERHQLTIPED